MPFILQEKKMRQTTDLNSNFATGLSAHRRILLSPDEN